MKNRRKKIVINKKFQYQYSLLVAAMAVLLVNGFIIFGALFPSQNTIELTFSTAIWLAGVEFVLLAGIWYASLVASHRIAGPVYVFAREVTKLGEGDLTANIRLRDKDMFIPEAEQMNTGIRELNRRIHVIKTLSEELKQAHDGGQDASNIIERLTSEVSNFKTQGE